MDFDVDLSKTSLIGQKYINVDVLHHGDEEKPVSLLAVTRKSSTNIDWESSWKKPHLSQVSLYKIIFGKNNFNLLKKAI